MAFIHFLRTQPKLPGTQVDGAFPKLWEGPPAEGRGEARMRQVLGRGEVHLHPPRPSPGSWEKPTKFAGPEPAAGPPSVLPPGGWPVLLNTQGPGLWSTQEGPTSQPSFSGLREQLPKSTHREHRARRGCCRDFSGHQVPGCCHHLGCHTRSQKHTQQGKDHTPRTWPPG